MKQQIKLTESQLRNMVRNYIMESMDECGSTPNGELEESELEEGFFGNLFKAGGQQIANKTSRAVNDFSQRFNNMNAQDASQQADAMDKEVEALPLQIKAQVKEYRSKLMRELNQRVNKYKTELMSGLQKKQTAATNMRNKANNYQNKANAAGDRLAAADRERYNNRGGEAQNMVAESKLDKIIKEAIRKNIK